MPRSGPYKLICTTRATDFGASRPDLAIADLAFQRLTIAFGKKFLRHACRAASLRSDARLSYDTDPTIAQAHTVIHGSTNGATSNTITCTIIASTSEDIRAAEVLECEGIHYNLTLFGVHQAIPAPTRAPRSSRPSSPTSSTVPSRTPARTTAARTAPASNPSRVCDSLNWAIQTVVIGTTPTISANTPLSHSDLLSHYFRDCWPASVHARTPRASSRSQAAASLQSKELSWTRPPSTACTPPEPHRQRQAEGRHLRASPPRSSSSRRCSTLLARSRTPAAVLSATSAQSRFT